MNNPWIGEAFELWAETDSGRILRTDQITAQAWEAIGVMADARAHHQAEKVKAAETRNGN